MGLIQGCHIRDFWFAILVIWSISSYILGSYTRVYATKTNFRCKFGPLITTKIKFSSGIYRFWKPWLVTWKLSAVSRATKSQNRRKTTLQEWQEKELEFASIIECVAGNWAVPSNSWHFVDSKTLLWSKIRKDLTARWCEVVEKDKKSWRTRNPRQLKGPEVKSGHS